MKKSLPNEGALFTSAELSEAIGADLETIKNWIRRGFINRVRIGGRQMPNRLFAADDVYKAAVTFELVKLGLGPSAASLAVDTIWAQCNRNDFLEDKQIYAIVFPTDKWTAVLCSQRQQGGPLYRFTSATVRTQEKVALPDRSFAMVPITGTLTRITERLESVIEATKELPTRN
jgi:hypothetical protein